MPSARWAAKTCPEDLAKIERQMHDLERDVLALQDSFGDTVLNLTLALGYVKKLLDAPRAAAYPEAYRPDLLAEFLRLVQEAASET